MIGGMIGGMIGPGNGLARALTLREAIDAHASVVAAMRADAGLHDGFARLAKAAQDCLRAGGKILLFGNGGSAADAQHIAAELVGRFKVERGPLAALALTTDTSALTAIGNDYGFDAIFARQIGGLAWSGDLAIGLTTSGRSRNVLLALESAKKFTGLTTAALTGASGLAGEADIVLAVPATDTARVQEAHILIGHALCGAIERGIGDDYRRDG